MMLGSCARGDRSEADELEATRLALLTALRRLAEQAKPNYALEGEHFAWGDLLKVVRETLAEVEARLAVARPFEERSQGCT